jgi:hypothetical protein
MFRFWNEFLVVLSVFTLPRFPVSINHLEALNRRSRGRLNDDNGSRRRLRMGYCPPEEKGEKSSKPEYAGTTVPVSLRHLR